MKKFLSLVIIFLSISSLNFSKPSIFNKKELAPIKVKEIVLSKIPGATFANILEFDKENVYYSSEHILSKIEEKFGNVYNKEFVKELRDTINTLNLKYDEFSFDTLEHDFSDCIEEADKFKNVEFMYYGDDWKIEILNEGIKNNEYLKTEKEKNKNENQKQSFSKSFRNTDDKDLER